VKKVFLIHGYHGFPNGAWRPWLMSELEKLEIYACALPMPGYDNPQCNQWINEIANQIDKNPDDEIYLVGHSLGSTAILRYLETKPKTIISGAILVSGPCKKNDNKNIDNFLENPFDFKTIKSRSEIFTIIHGENDPYVPINHGQILSNELNAELIIIPNGGHLNGSAGWFTLPQCLKSLMKMINK
jgi:uncharacterized protein